MHTKSKQMVAGVSGILVAVAVGLTFTAVASAQASQPGQAGSLLSPRHPGATAHRDSTLPGVNPAARQRGMVPRIYRAYGTARPVMQPRSRFAVVRHSVPSGMLTADNMQFTSGAVPSNMISQNTAIAAAEAIVPGRVGPGFTADAEYGTFTDNDRATMNAEGKVVLSYVNIPAWIVTFHSPSPEPSLAIRNPEGRMLTFSKSEWTYIVDASTGQNLLILS